MTSIREVHAVVEELWPAEGAEDWDAVGLISGDPDQQVSRILLAVDATIETAAEAAESGADLLLVHHPLLLRGVTTIAETTAKGRVLARLIRANCGLLAAHTNADVVSTGTSAELARLIGLDESVPLVGDADGLGRVGSLAQPVTLGALARHLATVLPSTATGVRVLGDWDRPVQRVAVCGGAGDSLLGNPLVRSADVYVTSDLRHHPALDAREAYLAGDGPALIDTSHWASEWLWLPVAAAQLRERLPGITVEVSELRTDPWDFALPQ